MKHLVAVLAVLVAGCGSQQDESIRQENELADWGERINIVLVPAEDGDPCTYTASTVRVGIGLELTAHVSARCP